MEIKFRTQYSNNVKPKTCHGSYLKKQCILAYDDRGLTTLQQTGVTDIYKQIQSHRDSCDLAIILSRLESSQVNGLMNTYQFDDILNSEVIDVFSFPKNPGEMLNLSKKGEELFKGLSPDIRAEFDFSPHKFISSFGSKEFMDKINNLAKKYHPDVEEPIVVKQGTKIQKNKNVDLNPNGGDNNE